MQIINCPWTLPTTATREIPLPTERAVLAKRRWQGVAADGCEFGFDLDDPLRDGFVFFATTDARYVIVQKPEALLEIALVDPVAAARNAWSLGNLHFPIEVGGGTIRVIDDPAVRLYLERDGVAFTIVSAVFHPIKAVSGHSHGHTH